MKHRMKTRRKWHVYSACFFVLFIVILSLCAEVIAPYDYERENRAKPYQPPTRIHLERVEQFPFIRPYVYETQLRITDEYARVYTEIGTVRYSIQWGVKVEPFRVMGIGLFDRKLLSVDAPADLHLMGTDERGRDLFSRVLVGGRISFGMALAGVVLSCVVGIMIGSISGYIGGRSDSFLMRVTELFMMIPTFYVLLAVRSALPSQLHPVHVFCMVTIILSLIGWAGLARIIRGMVLSIREQDFIVAARVLGSSPQRIILTHVIPHVLSYVVVVMSFSLPGYIFAESALSMLGLGIQEPWVSWGMLLGDALSITQLRFHLWMLYPGLMISLTVLACTMLGDALRDLCDPYMVHTS